MNGLIRASLKNPYAVTVMCLTLVVLGVVSARSIPVDILPVFNSPAVQVLTFYSGMPAASVEKDITNRMERWVGQAVGHAAAGVAVDRRRQHRPQLLPQRRRPQRRPDPGQLAGPGGHAQPAAGDLAAGRPAVRPDQHDAGVHRRPGQQDAVGVDPLRRRPLRGPEHDHGASRRRRAGGLRRQDPRRDGVPRPPEDAGAGPLAAGRDERDRQLQPVPADRRRQVRRRSTTRIDSQLDVRRWSSEMGEIPLRTEHGQRGVPARRGDAARTPASSRRTSCGSTAGDRCTSRSSASSGPARWRWSTSLKDADRRHEAAADAGRAST